jgi:hypothetical protein
MHFQKQIIFTIILLCSLGLTSSVTAQHSSSGCTPTGQWRLSNGIIIPTPVRFEIEYMMEMFLLCDYEKALDVLGPEGVEPIPLDLGGGQIAATCVLRYVKYASPDNKFYPTTELTPGYMIYNPDPEWYPDDPFHVVNYFLPNWGYGDEPFFDAPYPNDSLVPLANIYTEVLGTTGRTRIEFDQRTPLDDPSLFHMKATSSTTGLDLEVRLDLADPETNGQSNEPEEGWFWFHSPKDTGGHVSKTSFQLDDIRFHIYKGLPLPAYVPCDDVGEGDCFYVGPDSLINQLGIVIPMYFLIYPYQSAATFCMDSANNYKPDLKVLSKINKKK